MEQMFADVERSVDDLYEALKAEEKEYGKDKGEMQGKYDQYETYHHISQMKHHLKRALYHRRRFSVPLRPMPVQEAAMEPEPEAEAQDIADTIPEENEDGVQLRRKPTAPSEGNETDDKKTGKREDEGAIANEEEAAEGAVSGHAEESPKEAVDDDRVENEPVNGHQPEESRAEVDGDDKVENEPVNDKPEESRKEVDGDNKVANEPVNGHQPEESPKEVDVDDKVANEPVNCRAEKSHKEVGGDNEVENEPVNCKPEENRQEVDCYNKVENEPVNCQPEESRKGVDCDNKVENEPVNGPAGNSRKEDDGQAKKGIERGIADGDGFKDCTNEVPHRDL